MYYVIIESWDFIYLLYNFMILYIAEAVGLLLITIGLVWYFCHSSTPYYVRFVVTISFSVSFLCFMILPIDIY